MRNEYSHSRSYVRRWYRVGNLMGLRKNNRKGRMRTSPDDLTYSYL